MSSKVELVELVELHMLLSRMSIQSVPGERGSRTYVAADGCAIKSMIAWKPGGLNRRASGVMIHVLL
jgi:hypothetical protein